MNWIKRAFRSISYHKKNTILMFLSFLILSILILFGLCIRAASRERIWKIRTSIGGSVLVSNERQIYSEEPRGVNSISHQKYLELCADERIRFGSCNTVTAALADNFTAEIMDGQEENGTENIYVEGSSDPVEYFSSVSSVVTLISGHVPQNAEEAVVSDGIAERNGLGIGDTIAVLSPYTKERYTFKISGIYSTNEAAYSGNVVYNNPANAIYTLDTPVYEMNENDNVKEITLQLKDPEEGRAFAEDAKKMPEYIKEEYDMDYTVNVSAYKAVADSLKSLAGISNLMVIVSVILGTITLSFLILMNLRDRMFEIGILLSVGETKMRIMLQMLMESFCPVLLAITAGVIFSYPLANVIKIAVDLSNGVQAAIKTQQIIILYLCGMGVVLASSMVMVYQIVRYQPKKILMME